MRYLTRFYAIALFCSFMLGHGRALAQASFDTGTTALPPDLTLHSQNPFSIADGTHDIVALSFNQILTLYYWGANAQYTTGSRRFQTDSTAFPSPTGAALAVGSSRLDEETNTRTSEATALLTADVPLTQDDLIGSFLTFQATSFAVTSSNQFNEQSLGLTTNLLDGYADAGVRYGTPASQIRWDFGAGVARQSQTALDRYGTILRGEFNVAKEQIGENQQIQDSLLIDERLFPNQAQRLSNDHLTSLLTSILPGDGANDICTNFNFMQRDFYYTIDSTNVPVRQLRQELSAFIADSLQYPVIPSIMDADVNVSYEPRLVTRTIDASTTASVIANGTTFSSLIAPNDISDLGLSAEGKLLLFNNRQSNPADHPFSGSVSMRYEEHDETVTLRSQDIPQLASLVKQQLAEELNQASYSSATTQLVLAGMYAFSNTTSIAADGSARILHYNTPDPLNHDDRDELLTNARVQLSHIFTSDLSGNLELRVSKSHIVYLESDRSAQNNAMRTIALATGANYATRELTEQFHGEVFANYTIYDYADILPELAGQGSYLLRGIDMHDSTIVHLPNLSSALGDYFIFSGEMTLFERGSYNDSAFSEHPIEDNLQLSGTFALGLHERGSMAPYDLQLGVRAFMLRRSGIDETQLLNQNWIELEEQSRIGPMIAMTLNHPGQLGPKLSGEIWYGFARIIEQDVPGVVHQAQVESHLSVQWTF